MEFRTAIEPLQGLQGTIDHSRTIWTVGSCFADTIGSRLARDGFSVEVNPLGTLFNPASICRSLRNVVACRQYVNDDLVENEGFFHSLDFHSRFSSACGELTLKNINETICRLSSALPHLDVLMVTLGSARCFFHGDSPVANCHKLPASMFTNCDLDLDQWTAEMGELFHLLRGLNPGLTFILTISPVRHKSYGLHADRLSKANLLLGADRLVKKTENAIYFPAYEAVQDDLRDYRFYAPDMVHPSEVAADYVYELFASSFFTPTTLQNARDERRRKQREAHREIVKN